MTDTKYCWRCTFVAVVRPPYSPALCTCQLSSVGRGMLVVFEGRLEAVTGPYKSWECAPGVSSKPRARAPRIARPSQ